MNLNIPSFFTEEEESPPLPDNKPEQAPLLAKEARETAYSNAQSIGVYKAYQSNIRASNQLTTEIIKGVHEGESLYSLLLKACKAISLMTNDSLFYDTVKADTMKIYGDGLQVSATLQADLEETRGRLDKLTAAATIDPDNAKLKKAIQAHRERIARIEKDLEE